MILIKNELQTELRTILCTCIWLAKFHVSKAHHSSVSSSHHSDNAQHTIKQPHNNQQFIANISP